MLRLRRWCSRASNRWCEMRVRIDGRKGGLIETEAFWINFNRETQTPARIADDFMDALLKTTDVDRLRWKSYLKPGLREDADEIREFPIRVSDIDLFDHVNNSVYWKVVEEFLAPHRSYSKRRCGSPSSMTPPSATAANSRPRAHLPPGFHRQVGPDLTDRTVRTLTYVVGAETDRRLDLFALVPGGFSGGPVNAVFTCEFKLPASSYPLTTKPLLRNLRK